MTDKNEVTNDRRTRFLPKIILGQSLFTILIGIVAISIASYAQGNRFDFVHMKLIKTGIIVVKMNPKDALITVNGKETVFSSNYGINFEPGRYTVSASKKGYSPWERTVKVEPASVNIFDDAILFLSQPTVIDLIDQQKIALLNTPTDILATNATNSLYFTEHEISSGGTLISRFDGSIQKAIWYSDFHHVIYQQGTEIRVIDDSGTNDTLLVNLSSAKTALMAIGSGGTELYYSDGDSYKAAKIR
jgi:hypothetical protein